jgi:hypothetical protein
LRRLRGLLLGCLLWLLRSLLRLLRIAAVGITVIGQVRHTGALLLLIALRLVANRRLLLSTFLAGVVGARHRRTGQDGAHSCDPRQEGPRSSKRNRCHHGLPPNWSHEYTPSWGRQDRFGQTLLYLTACRTHAAIDFGARQGHLAQADVVIVVRN